MHWYEMRSTLFQVEREPEAGVPAVVLLSSDELVHSAAPAGLEKNVSSYAECPRRQGVQGRGAVGLYFGHACASSVGQKREHAALRVSCDGKARRAG